MNFSNLTNEDKKRISNERQNAVRKAWKIEAERVKSGVGTRGWTPEQQKEIIKRGSVSGYEGHHMKSVSLYPQYAGDPKNIQFLTEDEHLYGAHNGNYHNLTNGYYDPYEEKMIAFQDDELPEIPEIQLENLEENTIEFQNNDKSEFEETENNEHEEAELKNVLIESYNDKNFASNDDLASNNANNTMSSEDSNVYEV